MTGRLDGQVAVVTGGGHGIGREYCRGLAAEGAHVVVAEIDAAAAKRTAADLQQKGEALAVVTDVSSETSTQELAAAVLDRFGRIDILVNNAALFVTVP